MLDINVILTVIIIAITVIIVIKKCCSKPETVTENFTDEKYLKVSETKIPFKNDTENIHGNLEQCQAKCNLDKDYDLVISNLPYNLSSKVLEKLILIKNVPKFMILMFQKEFAERLLNKNLNSINSLIKCFFSIDLKFNVSKNCFRPSPKIQSSVLVFNKLNKSLISKNEIESFIKFKRYIFSYKRKTLRKILKNYNFENNFNLDLRAENLNLSDLIKIFRAINF